MLTAITEPTTRNLMAPETVLARLGLAAGELAVLTDQVAEASGMVARYLRYEPWYATWQETFAGVTGDRLYLGARPAWSVESVTYRDGTAQVADSYRLERGPFGESSIVLPLWASYPSGWAEGNWSVAPGLQISPSSVLPDWTAVYPGGWWLPEMTGEPPAGVDAFPPELERDFLKIVRWLRLTDGGLGALSSLGISKTSNEGASVEFFSAKDQAVDADTGLPAACTLSLALYRRAA